VSGGFQRLQLGLMQLFFALPFAFSGVLRFEPKLLLVCFFSEG